MRSLGCLAHVDSLGILMPVQVFPSQRDSPIVAGTATARPTRALLRAAVRPVLPAPFTFQGVRYPATPDGMGIILSRGVDDSSSSQPPRPFLPQLMPLFPGVATDRLCRWHRRGSPSEVEELAEAHLLLQALAEMDIRAPLMGWPSHPSISRRFSAEMPLRHRCVLLPARRLCWPYSSPPPPSL